MPGALPDLGNGGVAVRDANGACLNPVNVVNAYCPPATFESTCELTALPSDCTGKIVPAQINGIVSEMLCFAATLCPDGTWNCDNNCNMASAFGCWAATNKIVDGVTIIGDGVVGDEWRVDPDGVVDAICADDPARQALAACVISTDAGQLLEIAAGDNLLFMGLSADAGQILTISPGDGRAYLSCAEVVTSICATLTCAQALSECLLSTDPDNTLVLGADGLLYTSGIADCEQIVALICGSVLCRQTLAACLISTDDFNQLQTAAGDALLFVQEDHVLHGTVGLTYPNIPAGLAPGNAQPNGAQVFNIPNNSDQPITVAIGIKAHGLVLPVEDSNQGTQGEYFMFFDATNTPLGNYHFQGRSGTPGQQNAIDSGGDTGQIRNIVIPPGGIDIRLENSFTVGVGSTSALVFGNRALVHWYGVTADAEN